MTTQAELFDALPSIAETIRTEIQKKVVGQAEVIDQMLLALFSNGHCLFVGVPWFGKDTDGKLFG